MDWPPSLAPFAAPFTEIDSVAPPFLPLPSDRAISDCAYDLYQQSGCVPGRDVENWFAACDALRAPATTLEPTPPSAPPRPHAPAELPRDIPAAHALGDQAGRAAYTLAAS